MFNKIDVVSKIILAKNCNFQVKMSLMAVKLQVSRHRYEQAEIEYIQFHGSNISIEWSPSRTPTNAIDMVPRTYFQFSSHWIMNIYLFFSGILYGWSEGISN